MKENECQQYGKDCAGLINGDHFIDIPCLQGAEIAEPGCPCSKPGQYKKQHGLPGDLSDSRPCVCQKYHKPGEYQYHNGSYSCRHIRIRLPDTAFARIDVIPAKNEDPTAYTIHMISAPLCPYQIFQPFQSIPLILFLIITITGVQRSVKA